MYLTLAPLVGAMLTVMNGINALLSKEVGSLVSVLVIHLVGLGLVGLICLLRREGSSLRGVPPWLWGGGVLGVGTVFTCNAAFAGLGASLAVALALLGQVGLSLVVDGLGLFGRKRYPPSVRVLPGLALALLGVGVMAGRLEGRLPAVLAALAGGALPVLSFTLNSQLGARIGIWRGALANYVTGLGTTLLVVLALRPDLGAAARTLGGISPLHLTGGGVLGVLMVGASNVVFPRLPALTSTLLIFSGQALSGLAVDALLEGHLGAAKLGGSLLVMAGLGINALLAQGAMRRAST